MQEVREVLPFGRSGERREEQISRGANGIIKTEGGSEERKGGRRRLYRTGSGGAPHWRQIGPIPN